MKLDIDFSKKKRVQTPLGQGSSVCSAPQHAGTMSGKWGAKAGTPVLKLLTCPRLPLLLGAQSPLNRISLILSATRGRGGGVPKKKAFSLDFEQNSNDCAVRSLCPRPPGSCCRTRPLRKLSDGGLSDLPHRTGVVPGEDGPPSPVTVPGVGLWFHKAVAIAFQSGPGLRAFMPSFSPTSRQFFSF